MVEICAIASGSNGNCYYIGNEDDAILIDTGISCRQTINRMNERELDPDKLRAIFITHEHSDHLYGARVISKRLKIPVYITAKTYTSAYRNLQPPSPRFFTPGDEIHVGEFTVCSFLKNHDTPEPCSFRVYYSGINVGVFTDIGEPCENVKSQITLCDAMFLETNYDEKMLWEGTYPWPLKKRIASVEGHLSNKQAYDLLDKYGSNKLKLVFLNHLSAENNSPEAAFQTIKPLETRFEIRLTSRYQAGEVYRFI